MTTTNAESFTLDAASNIASRTGPSATYSYDTSNRLTSDGTSSFTWSNADRLTVRGSDTFGYDPLDRLTSSTVSGTSRTYTYDGDGLLESRTQGGSTTNFLWDPATAPSRLLQVGSDKVVYGLGPLYAVTSSATTTFASDGTRSIRAELNGSGGLAASFRYRAYGQVVQTSGSAQPGYLGYASQLLDSSGLYYMRARWYDSVTERFLTRDPLAALVASSSLSAFAYPGNPVTSFDPSGLDPDALFDPGGISCVTCFGAPEEFVADADDGASDDFDSACRKFFPNDLVGCRHVAVTVPIADDEISIPVAGPNGTISVSAAKRQDPPVPGGGGGDGKGLDKETTYLYDKLDRYGNHMKYGITNNPKTRYTRAQLAGGRLKLLLRGTREDILAMERWMHENLPLGPEEGQEFYIKRNRG